MLGWQMVKSSLLPGWHLVKALIVLELLATSSSSGGAQKRFDGFALRRKDCRTVIGRRIQCSTQAPPPAWPGSAFPEPGRRTWDGPKPISIVGSTGSIGTQTLEIVAESCGPSSWLKCYSSCGSGNPSDG
ncbi:hypothetical protein ACLB2K_026180 [Fragaria x ananassa]